MCQSVKKRADVVFQDFMVRSSYNWVMARSIREIIGRSQAYVAKRIFGHPSTINTYENGGKISKQAEKDLLDYISQLNYTKYAESKTDDYIIYTIRVMSNYIYHCHDWGLQEDDKMIKKLIGKQVSMMCFE